MKLSTNVVNFRQNYIITLIEGTEEVLEMKPSYDAVVVDEKLLIADKNEKMCF